MGVQDMLSYSQTHGKYQKSETNKLFWFKKKKKNQNNFCGTLAQNNLPKNSFLWQTVYLIVSTYKQIVVIICNYKATEI